MDRVTDDSRVSGKRRSRLREQFEDGIAALGLGAGKHPIATILLLLATVLFCGLQIPTLQFASSPDLYLDEDEPARIAYDNMREQFGRDDLVFIAITPPDGGKVFELEFLEQIRDLHLRLEAELPWLDEVQSLVTARLTIGVEDGLVVGELMEDWPTNSTVLQELELRALNQPFYRNLYLSDDGRTTGIVVRPLTYPATDDADVFAGFEDETSNLGEEPELEFIQFEQMDELAYKLREVLADFDFGGAEVHAVGLPVLNTELQLDVVTDMALFSGISIVVIAVLLWAVFRRGIAIALPLITVTCAAIITLGLMALFGRPMTMVSQIVPPFILAVGVGFAVHLLAIYFQRVDLGEAGEERGNLMGAALKHSGPAIVMSAMTTAFGMASFMSSDLTPVRDVGIFVPVGVLVAALLALTLVPSVLALVKVERKPTMLASDSSPVTERALVACAQFGTRHPIKVVLVTLAVLVGAASAIPTIPPGYNVLDWISDDGPYSQGTLSVNETLGGAGNMEVVVDTGEEGGLYNPQNLRRIDAIQQYLEDTPGNGFSFQKTTSISDVVKEINRALNEGQNEAYVLPDNRALIAQELLLFENSGSDDLEQLTDSEFRTARISAKGEHADGAEYLRYLSTHVPKLREIAGGMTLTITGLLHLNADVVRLVIKTAIESYLIAFLLITPIMILFIGSFRSGIVSLAPNLIPIAIVMGVMGWAQTPLDVFTALIGGIALGLVVDDTLHILHAFRVYYDKTGDLNEAIARTMETTGRAIMFTTLVLTSGFAIYGFATAQSVVAFGLLTALAVFLAFFLDLVLTPALLALIYRGKQLRATEH